MGFLPFLRPHTQVKKIKSQTAFHTTGARLVVSFNCCYVPFFLSVSWLVCSSIIDLVIGWVGWRECLFARRSLFLLLFFSAAGLGLDCMMYLCSASKFSLVLVLVLTLKFSSRPPLSFSSFYSHQSFSAAACSSAVSPTSFVAGFLVLLMLSGC